MDWEILSNKPLWKKIINQSFWLYFFTLLITPIWYIIRILISNSVSIWDVWVIYSIIGFIWLLAVYHDLWLTESLQYHLPKYRINKQYNAFKTSIYFTLIVQTVTWIILAIMLFFWSNFLAANYFHSPESAHTLQIFCLYFLWLNIFNILYSIYIAFQDIIQYKLIESIRSIVTLLFTVFFFLSNILDITNFTRSFVIWLWVSLLISSILFFRKYWKIVNKWTIELDVPLLKKQLKYSFWIFIGINVNLLLSQVDQQFVIYFLWTEAAWYYANYLSLIMSFSVIVSPLLAYLFPLTTELIEKKQLSQLITLKNMFYKYFSLFAISVSWLFMVLGEEIATILFWIKFLYSWTLLTYSSLFLIFYVLFSINLSFLAGMWKAKQRAKIIVLALIINITLNYIFIQFRGMIWVISATILSRILLYYMSYKIINEDWEIIFNWSYFIKNISIIMVLCILLYYYKEIIFTMVDSYRYTNIFYLLIIFIIYYSIITLFNLSSIKMLLHEIKRKTQ